MRRGKVSLNPFFRSTALPDQSRPKFLHSRPWLHLRSSWHSPLPYPCHPKGRSTGTDPSGRSGTGCWVPQKWHLMHHRPVLTDIEITLGTILDNATVISKGIACCDIMKKVSFDDSGLNSKERRSIQLVLVSIMVVGFQKVEEQKLESYQTNICSRKCPPPVILRELNKT